MSTEMSTLKMAAVILIAAGIVASFLVYAYGGFTYTREPQAAMLEPVELSVKDRERGNVPVLAGVGTIAIGGVLMVVGGK